LTKLLDEGKTLEAIMDDLFKDLSLKISKTEITRFICDCSRQRITKALTSIGKNDLIEMISDQEDIEVNCDFCKEKYSFSPEDLQSILDHRTDSREQEG
jgi:molecular chaperone Hsp33